MMMIENKSMNESVSFVDGLNKYNEKKKKQVLMGNICAILDRSKFCLFWFSKNPTA